MDALALLREPRGSATELASGDVGVHSEEA